MNRSLHSFAGKISNKENNIQQFFEKPCVSFKAGEDVNLSGSRTEYAAGLFSIFTANIIKKKVVFIR